VVCEPELRTSKSTPAKASGQLTFFWLEPRSGRLTQVGIFAFKIRVKLQHWQDRVELLLSDDEEDVNSAGS